jgi:hypothetical protein
MQKDVYIYAALAASKTIYGIKIKKFEKILQT